MNVEEYEKAINDVIWLAGCVMNETIPDRDRLDRTDLSLLYNAANKHMLTAIVGYALEKAGIYDERFVQAKAKSIRKITVMEIDKQRLFERFEEEKIRYMPLKGAVIKDYYPSVGLRQLSDYDIWFDRAYAEKVRKIMTELGFTCEHFGENNHDVYFKQPVSNFEMHTFLFNEMHKTELFKYYENIDSKLIKDEGNAYGYHFSNEDLYIYLTAHEYKHFSRRGTGLRSVLDTYLFLKRFGSQLDMEYVKAEAAKLDIAEFERKSRSLAMDLFVGNDLSEENKEMLRYIVFSGTYGTLQNKLENHVLEYGGGSGGKRRFLLRRLFPTMKEIKKYYPSFYKYKILIPFLPFYKSVEAMTVKRKQTKEKLKILKNIK